MDRILYKEGRVGFMYKTANDLQKYLFKAAKELDLLPCRGQALVPGDLYLAHRNSGPNLLTVKEVKEGVVIPLEKSAYCYDIWECLKVKPI